VIGDESLARALRTRWPKSRGPVESKVGKLTQLYASVLTTKNPLFWPKQFIRDITSTPLLVGSEIGGAVGLEVAKNIVKLSPLLSGGRYGEMLKYFNSDNAGKGRFRQEWANSGDPLLKYFDEASANGMVNLFTEQFDLLNNNALRDLGSGRGRNAIQKVSDGMDAVANANDTMHRLAAYAAMRDAGVSAPEAARYAREIINFSQNTLANDGENSTGEASKSVFRAAYVFARSGMVGADRTLNRAIWKDGRAPYRFERGPDGQVRAVNQGIGKGAFEHMNKPLILGMMATGYMTTLMAAHMMGDGFGEDDEGIPLGRKIPPSIFASNVVVPFFGVDANKESHTLVPLQLGAFQFFHGIGSLAALAQGGFLNEKQAAMEAVNLALTNGTPLPRMSPAESIDVATFKSAAPSILRPFASLALNSNDFGSPIRAGSRVDAYQGGSFTRAFNSTPDTYTNLSRQIYQLGGERPGIDPSGESMRYLFKSFGGAPAQFADKMMAHAGRAEQGLDKNSIPSTIGNMFAPSYNSDRYFSNGEYWDQRERAHRYVVAYNSRLRFDEQNGTATAGEMTKLYPRVPQLRTMISRASRELTGVNKAKAAIDADTRATLADKQQRHIDIENRRREIHLRYSNIMRDIVNDIEEAKGPRLGLT